MTGESPNDTVEDKADTEGEKFDFDKLFQDSSAEPEADQIGDRSLEALIEEAELTTAADSSGKDSATESDPETEPEESPTPESGNQSERSPESSLDILASRVTTEEDARSAGDFGRFEHLLADIDPSESDLDLDELLERLTESESLHQVIDPTETDEADPDPTQDPSQIDISFEADREQLLGTSNTLFAAPRNGRLDGDRCHPLVSMYPLEDSNVLLISLQDSSEKRLDGFFSVDQSYPANLAVVTGGDSVRSTTTSRSVDLEQEISNLSVKVVTDPGDLTRLGITISNVLKSWVGNGHETIVCFDSVSVLLQYATLQRVFRFIHVLQGRLDEVGARSHFHLDPEAHDNQTVGTLQPLFNGTIRSSEDGSLVYQ